MDRGYFVFGYQNDEVDSLLGSSAQIPEWDDNFTRTEEVVTLPRAFMMGYSFQATVFRNAGGRKVLAYIPIASRPLAL